MSDEETIQLIKRAQENDAQALGQLYEENFKRVYRYVYIRLGNAPEAEDITQQVFIKVLDSIRSFRWTGAPFISWLLRIAHNQVVDHYRRTSRMKTVALEDVNNDPVLEARTEDPSEIAEKEMEIQRVTRAIQELPVAQREVVALRFTSDLSIAETAKILGKREGTVKALQFNAMVSLRRILCGYRDAKEET